MQTQSDAVRRFTEAWKSGNDDSINRITMEITQSGNDADLAAITRVMGGTPHGGE
ncbi:hypothetical protein [Streptomyces sp. NPDC008150]|uniref:hypothetical protein n=1 Tax=Streptomyces sp. NPDC008150 TaxID=3364816 RepID=UPI0036EC4406